jgi:sulfide:quinone oxidoreductase
MALLKESRVNHLGKLAFRWIYWNILMPGRSMPVPPLMSLKGKKTELLEQEEAKEPALCA